MTATLTLLNLSQIRMSAESVVTLVMMQQACLSSIPIGK